MEASTRPMGWFWTTRPLEEGQLEEGQLEEGQLEEGHRESVGAPEPASREGVLIIGFDAPRDYGKD